MPTLIRPILILAILASSGASQADLATRINPFIGTGGHGHTFPGPTLPFGMVQLSPDTRLTGWDGCSGYHFEDTVVYGFSHTHLSGTGVSDYGDILLMPVTGAPLLNNGCPEQPDAGYGSRPDDRRHCRVERQPSGPDRRDRERGHRPAAGVGHPDPGREDRPDGDP